MSIEITKNGFYIDGTSLLTNSGTIDYWRYKPEIWPLLLDRAIELGIKSIKINIPWNIHEIEYDTFDFGENKPSNNVRKFIDLCEHKKLSVVLGVGPCIGSELNYYGLPERIFDDSKILMRTSDDTPSIVFSPPKYFPAPSYVSEEFLFEVERFYKAISKQAGDLQYPDGPIVAVHIDDNISFFSRFSQFEVDYSSPSVSLYHRYLKSKYDGDVDLLNNTYSTEYVSFDNIIPPKDFSANKTIDLAYYFDWCEYREFYIYYSLSKLSSLLKHNGIDKIPFIHNFNLNNQSVPFHIPMSEKAVDVQSVDINYSRDEYEKLKIDVRMSAGSSRISYINNLTSGSSVWDRPIFFNDFKFASLAILMNGAKSINYHMLSDRDRWFGAPVSFSSSKNDNSFNFLKKLSRFRSENIFNEYKISSDILLLRVRDYERLENLSNIVNPIPSFLFKNIPSDWLSKCNSISGLSDDIPSTYGKQWRAFLMGFSQAGFHVSLSDSDIDIHDIEKFRVVIAPSFDFMNMGLQKKLLVYALKGGVLVLGPRIPFMNEHFNKESKFTTHTLEPVTREKKISVGGMVFEHADLFEAKRPFLQEAGKTCAYATPAEKGTIIHLGFVFQDYKKLERSPGLANIMKRIAAVAGLTAQYPVSDPLVETALFENGLNKIIFIANPCPESKNVTIHLKENESLSNVFSKELIAGPNVELNLSEFCIEIFHIY